jgi:hypothetical protein
MSVSCRFTSRASFVAGALAICASTIALADEANDASLRQALVVLEQAVARVPPDADGARWTFNTTPPFPDGTAWIVYGYGVRFRPHLYDAAETGSVFASARPHDGVITVEVLSTTIKKIGMQGTRNPPTAITSAQRAAAHAWVMNGHRGATPEVVALVYCDWARKKRKIVDELPAPARSFLSPLRCPQAATPLQDPLQNTDL